MKLKAYAKLNLALNITGVLESGMHELDMLMQNISLADELTIEKADTITLNCAGMEIDDQNTTLKAAKAFFEYAGIAGGAAIGLKKTIPSQAGLGGGSSDAGAVLNALNLLYETNLKKEELAAIGVGIGADVPFFIYGGCMRAQGIGEILSPIENQCRFSYLLIKPKGGVSTAGAYQAYHTLPKVSPNIDEAVQALTTGDKVAYFKAAGNALMPAGIETCPQVGTILEECKEYGANFAMMTGSGSCVFAVFSDEVARQKAFVIFSEQYPFCTMADQTEKAFELI